jgi:hypothetical protein
MFKQGGFGDEIFRSMEKTLVKNQVDNTFGLSRLAKAVDYLNDAAVIFESAGMNEEASEITKVLQALTKDLSKTANIHHLAKQVKHYLSKMNPDYGWEQVDDKLLSLEIDPTLSAEQNAKRIRQEKNLSPDHFLGDL